MEPVKVATLRRSVLARWLIQKREVWKWERVQLNNVSEGCGGNNIPAWKHLISSRGPNLAVAASAADSLPESLLPCLWAAAVNTRLTWILETVLLFYSGLPPCLGGGGTRRVRVTSWNVLMCYNLLHYLWKQKRASLCAGRLPCQPRRVVSSPLFLPIWLVLARLPFRRSRPIITLSRWHLCGWCVALRGSPINIRYTHTRAGAHAQKLWHTFQLTWNTSAAVCPVSDVMLHV